MVIGPLPISSVKIGRDKPPPTWFGRLLRQLLKGFGIFVVACLVSYPFTPHDAAANVVPPPKADQIARIPKGSVFIGAVQCSKDKLNPKPCVAAKFLSLANQLGDALLDRTVKAQSSHPTTVEIGFTKLMAR